MKQIDLSGISGTTGLVLRKQELVQLNSAAYQVAKEIATALFSTSGYASNTLYVLYGCVISGGANSWSCTAGAIFYNGEIYVVDAVSNAPTTANTYYFGTKRFNDATQGTSTSGLIDDIYENKIVFYGNVTPTGATTIWSTGGTLNRITDLINLNININTAQTTANSAQTTANDALPKAGGTMTGNIVLPATTKTGNQAISVNDFYSLFVTNFGTGSITSGLVAAVSGAGTIATYTSGTYSFILVGNLVTLNIKMILDLDNNWSAGDYLTINLSGMGINAPNAQVDGIGVVSPAGGAANPADLYLQARNGSNTFRMVFIYGSNNPTGSGGVIQGSVSYRIS